MSELFSPQAIRLKQIESAKNRYNYTLDYLCSEFQREIQDEHPEKNRLEVQFTIDSYSKTSKQRPDLEALRTDFTNRLIEVGWEMCNVSLQWSIMDGNELDAKIVMQFPTKETIANSPYRG